jgi:hypothetical protein
MKVNYLYCVKVSYSLYLPHYHPAMKRCVLFTFLILLSGIAVRARPLFQAFDISGVYFVLASGTVTGIDSELAILQISSIREKDAYEGALLMRKAGFLSRPKDKLTTFKSGYIKLESALTKDSGNPEYHFLRLMIQEHAPKVVHYDKDKERDSQDVIRSFSRLSIGLQKAILDYSKHSKFLDLKNLNG